jgi:hypothetical protein
MSPLWSHRCSSISVYTDGKENHFANGKEDRVEGGKGGSSVVMLVVG